MALEDEIINITDLDVGTELLNTDKLLIETNNGTKLLAFKDFVIGVDNITFKNRLLDTTGTGTNYNPVFTSIGDAESTPVYEILNTDTIPGHKPTYKDLEGTIELTKNNYYDLHGTDGSTGIGSLTGAINSNTLTIQDINSQIGSLRSDLTDQGFAMTSNTLSSVNFQQKGPGTTVDHFISFSSTPDVNPNTSNPDVGYTNSPNWKFTLPSTTSYSTSLILFSGSLVVQESRNLSKYPLELKKNGKTVKQIFTQGSYTNDKGNKEWVYQFTHVESVNREDYFELWTPLAVEAGPTSSFAGVKING